MADKHPAQLAEIDAIRDFVLGGNAKFTLVSVATEARYTYKVRVSDDKGLYFVSALGGPDNENDYIYAGIIPADTRQFRLTKKSGFNHSSKPILAFSWFWSTGLKALSLPGEQLDPRVEFWHEGCCCRCGRTLTVPSSIAAGIGPECASKGGF